MHLYWFIAPGVDKAIAAAHDIAEKTKNRIHEFIFRAVTGGAAACIMVMFLSPALFAAGVSLNWKAPLQNDNGTVLTDLQGYIVYFGEQSGNYTGSVDVGKVTNYRMTNLSPGRTYYFAVSAYDGNGNESRLSNEAGTVIPYTSEGSSLADSDVDGIPDDGDRSGVAGDNVCYPGRLTNCDDNCALTANPFQEDTDSDGYGNACDCDLDNDNFVSYSDFSLFYAAMISTPSSLNWRMNADFDSDGYIGKSDYDIFAERWMTRAPWD